MTMSDNVNYVNQQCVIITGDYRNCHPETKVFRRKPQDIVYE